VERQKAEKVIISMDMKHRLIRDKIRKTINHLTVLRCVAASGDALSHPIVTSCKVPDDIDQGGHRPGKDFPIERNVKSCTDRAIFERSIRHHHIPYITALGMNPCCSKAEAVLLMDNCSAHVTPEIFGLLGENQVKIVTFAPHTTSILRALDLSVFGVFESKKLLDGTGRQ
jgi:hypothetical protein